MPVFEIEANGKTYEVEAPNEQAAVAALQGQSAPAQPAGDWRQYQYGVTPEQQAKSNVGALGALARVPTTFAEGAGQLVMRLGNKLGIVGDDTARNYEEAVKASRDEFARTNNLGSIAPGASDTLTSLVPVGGTAMTTEKIGGKILSYLWQLGKAGATGGTLAAAQYTPEDQSKLTQTAWGAAFPMAAQAIAGLAPTAGNIIASAIQNANTASAPRIQQALATARQFFTGSRVDRVPYTLAQESGNPVLQRLELQARGRSMNELTASQLDATGARFNELADWADMAAKAKGGSAVPGDVVEGAHKAVATLTRELKGIANSGYERGLDEVVAMGKGNFARVPTPRLQAAYRSVAAERDNPFMLERDQTPDTRKALDILMRLDKVGGADVGTTAQLLKGISSGQRSENSNVRRIASGLRDALEADLDEALSARGMPVPAGTRNATRDPFDRLMEVRGEYAARRAKVDRLENDQITRIFGSPEVMGQPRAALNKFYSLAPEDQKFAVDVLKERAPEVLDGMQADRLRQMLQDATVLGPSGNSTFDLNKFRTAMYDGKGGVANTHLWDDVTRKRLLQGGAHLQVLQNSLGGLGGTPVQPSDIAINIVSRDPAFTTRLLTRVAYGKYGDKLLGTPQGLDALRTLTSIGKTGSQAAADGAFAFVMGLLEKEQEDAQQAQGGQQ